MTPTYKNHLARKVRQRFGLQLDPKIHFTAQEMMTIVSKIKGIPLEEVEWTSIQFFFEEELYGLGWNPQDTVDTHPITENLEFLKSVKFQKHQPDVEPIDMNDTEAEENQSKNFTFRSLLKIINSYDLNPTEITIEKDKFIVKF